MNEFYNAIKDIAAKRKELPSERDILERHKKEIFNLITDGYKINIQNAVNSGSDTSYVCMYRLSSKYMDTIHIHELLDPSDTIKKISAEFSISSLLDDLNKFFNPFTVSLQNLDGIVVVSVSW